MDHSEQERQVPGQPNQPLTSEQLEAAQIWQESLPQSIRVVQDMLEYGLREAYQGKVMGLVMIMELTNDQIGVISSPRLERPFNTLGYMQGWLNKTLQDYVNLTTTNTPTNDPQPGGEDEEGGYEVLDHD